MINDGVPMPIFRRLRGYSFDPSLSVQLDTALFDEAVFKIRWEERLEKGLVGTLQLGREAAGRFVCPTSGDGIWWHVCDVDLLTTFVTEVNQIGDSP